MSARSKKTAGAMAGAVTLAFGAYAVGSQADDGSAVADGAASTATSAPAGAPGRSAFLRGPRGAEDVDDLARELGVEATALREALAEARDELPGPVGRTDPAPALAKALDVPAAEVRSALEGLRPARGEHREERRDALAAALAKELGLDAAKVRSAFEAARPERGTRRGPGRRADRRAAVAKALGVSAAELEAALEKVRPDAGARDDRRDALAGALAKALDVDAAKVRTALDQLRADHHAAHEARRDALAAALATKLRLDAAKVREALESARPEGRGFGGRGRHRHP